MKFDLAKILDVSKRYWVIIVFCVVMVIAMVAVPTFVASQAAALQKRLNDSKAVDDQIKQVMQKQRHQPVVSLDTNATAPELTRFPNDKVIAAGQAAIGGVQSQSQKLKEVSLAINRRLPLLPPTDPYRFQQTYLKQFTTEIPKLLNAATPPTDEEIKYRADIETQALTEKQPHNTVTGEIMGKEVLQQNINQKLATLPEQMRQEAATQHKMYMSPAALSLQPALAPPAPGAPTVVPDAEQMWLAQMGLWVQQDVVNAIAKLNQSATNVDTAVVKELVEIFVPTDRSMYVLPNAAAGAGGGTTPAAGAGPDAAAASAVPASTDTDPFPRDYSVSQTGRVCNGVYDVVQFDVVLNVQAKDVERVIQELERSRLITVNQAEVQAVNSDAMKFQGYYYGKTPIVTLTLRCEELFLREWTHTLMPDSIKKFLNVDQQPAAAPSPTASAQ